MAPAGAWALPARADPPEGAIPALLLGLGVLGVYAFSLWTASKVRVAELEAGRSPRRRQR